MINRSGLGHGDFLLRFSQHGRSRWEVRGDGRPAQEAIASAYLIDVLNGHEREP